jgi:hypothetical protein
VQFAFALLVPLLLISVLVSLAGKFAKQPEPAPEPVRT